MHNNVDISIFFFFMVVAPLGWTFGAMMHAAEVPYCWWCSTPSPLIPVLYLPQALHGLHTSMHY